MHGGEDDPKLARGREHPVFFEAGSEVVSFIKASCAFVHFSAVPGAPQLLSLPGALWQGLCCCGYALDPIWFRDQPQQYTPAPEALDRVLRAHIEAGLHPLRCDTIQEFHAFLLHSTTVLLTKEGWRGRITLTMDADSVYEHHKVTGLVGLEGIPPLAISWISHLMYRHVVNMQGIPILLHAYLRMGPVFLLGDRLSETGAFATNWSVVKSLLQPHSPILHLASPSVVSSLVTQFLILSAWPLGWSSPVQGLEPTTTDVIDDTTGRIVMRHGTTLQRRQLVSDRFHAVVSARKLMDLGCMIRPLVHDPPLG
jgi:hypothetical protein